jgi:hypothetical protein
MVGCGPGGVPRKKVDATKLLHALLMVAEELGKEAGQESRGGGDRPM